MPLDPPEGRYALPDEVSQSEDSSFDEDDEHLTARAGFTNTVTQVQMVGACMPPYASLLTLNLPHLRISILRLLPLPHPLVTVPLMQLLKVAPLLLQLPMAVPLLLQLPMAAPLLLWLHTT